MLDRIEEKRGLLAGHYIISAAHIPLVLLSPYHKLRGTRTTTDTVVSQW